MKIVFMGTPDFAAGILEALYEAEYDIAAVVTQPDRPRGRKGEPVPSDVKKCALAHGTRVLQPVKIREPEAVKELEKIGADLFVVAAFGQILPKEILEMPRLGCINVHASLLPKYRGAAPIQQAILDGETETGVTIMQMAEGLDTGDILSRMVYPISEEETGGSLFEALTEVGAKLLITTIPLLEEGNIFPIPQDDSQSSYVKMLKKEDGRLDFSQSATALFNRVRGLDPWPGAFTIWKGKQLKIWRATALREKASGMAPGSVFAAGKEGIDVVCGEGMLRIRELQMEGKKRMSAADFLLGRPMEKGEQLG
jgi:methionyl-tRNA formyltransferase